MIIKKITCFFSVLTFVIGQNTLRPEQMYTQENDVDPLENNILQNTELLREQQFQQLKRQSMNEWVAQETKEFGDSEQILVREAFALQLRRQAQFRWNPSKQGDFKMIVQVFDEDKGYILYPQNPSRDSNVEILIKPEGGSTFKSIGKVYIKKMFTVPFYRDHQTLLLKNNYNEKMLVQISLSDSQIVANKGIADTVLEISNKKMSGIMSEIKDSEIRREKLYRSQFSFKDRQQRHQSQMLILTGVELMVILGTSIVQVYCIKSLLENRSVV